MSVSVSDFSTIFIFCQIKRDVQSGGNRVLCRLVIPSVHPTAIAERAAEQAGEEWLCGAQTLRRGQAGHGGSSDGKGKNNTAAPSDYEEILVCLSQEELHQFGNYLHFLVFVLLFVAF